MTRQFDETKHSYLQLIMPYQSRVHRYLYCTNGFGRGHPFNDLYSENKAEYLDKLRVELSMGQYNDVVLIIDATLNKDWIHDVTNLVEDFMDTGLTLETRDTNHQNMTIKFDMILSKQFDFNDVLELIDIYPNFQYTVRLLPNTSEKDAWVEENRLGLSPYQRTVLIHLGVQINEGNIEDECNNKVFREDGNLYHNWYERP